MEIKVVGTDKVSIAISPKSGTTSILSIAEDNKPKILDIESNKESLVIVLLRDVKEKWISGYYQEIRRLGNKKWPWFFIDKVQDGVDGDTGLKYLKIFMERLDDGYYINKGWNHEDDVTVFGLKTMIQIHSSDSHRFNNLDWQTSRHAMFWRYVGGSPEANLFTLINLSNIYFIELKDLNNPKFLEWLQERDEKWKEVKEIPYFNKTTNNFKESIYKFWKDYSNGKIEMLKGVNLICYLYPEYTFGVNMESLIIESFTKEVQTQIDFIREQHSRYLKFEEDNDRS